MKVTRYTKVIKNFGYFLAFGLAHSAWALHRQNIKAQVENKRLHVLIMTGGLGDIVAADPAIRRITREDEHVVVLARPSYLAALDFHPKINTKIRVDSYVQALLLRRIFGLARWTNFHEDGHRCNMFQISIKNPNANGINTANYYTDRTLADVYSTIVLGKRADETPRTYPDENFDAQNFLSRIFGLDKKPILFIHTQATAAVRSWPAEQCRAFADMLLAKTGLNIIELGLNPVLAKSKRVYLLRDELSLGQQQELIKRATIFLGVDSGFSHIANAIGLPCVFMLGKYGNFSNYSPWKIRETDILLRAQGMLDEISPKTVFDAVVSLLPTI